MIRLFLLICLVACSCRPSVQEPPAKQSAAIPKKTAVADPRPAVASTPLSGELEKDATGLQVSYRGTPIKEAKRIVVLFHGYGADEEDLADFHQVIDAGPATAFVFPRAPIALAGRGYAWFSRDGHDFETGYLRAHAFVAWITREAPQAGLIVGGFSQGAILTANLIESLPPQTEAAVIFSPAAHLPHPPKDTTRKLPIFISHGSDDPILSFAGGKSLHDKFQMSGFQVTWQPFVGGHTISKEVLAGLNHFLRALPPHPQ